MSSYVVEVGVKSGEGAFEQWESQGFYAGYEPHGGTMILGPMEKAFRFASLEIASRIPAGDQRIAQTHRIVQSVEEPNV